MCFAAPRTPLIKAPEVNTIVVSAVHDKILRRPGSPNVLWFEYMATDIIGLATRFARRLTFSAFFSIEQPSAG